MEYKKVLYIVLLLSMIFDSIYFLSLLIAWSYTLSMKSAVGKKKHKQTIYTVTTGIIMRYKLFLSKYAFCRICIYYKFTSIAKEGITKDVSELNLIKCIYSKNQFEIMNSYSKYALMSLFTVCVLFSKSDQSDVSFWPVPRPVQSRATAISCRHPRKIGGVRMGTAREAAEGPSCQSTWSRAQSGETADTPGLATHTL